MTRNLAPAYCLLPQPGNLGFQARMPFCDSNSEAARLFMQNSNANTRWLTPDKIVIATEPAFSKTMQMLWALRLTK